MIVRLFIPFRPSNMYIIYTCQFRQNLTYHPDRLNLKDVKFSSLRISSTICSYFSDSGSAYSCKISSVTFPFSKRSMTLLVIRSISEEEREKFRYLQPYNNGGHAGRICTSFAPLWYKNSVVSRKLRTSYDRIIDQQQALITDQFFYC